MSRREQAGPLGGADEERGVVVTARPPATGVDILCLSGVLDTDEATTLLRELAPHMERASRTGRRLVLDLSDLRFVSAAAVRTLGLHTRRLDREPVLVIAPPPRYGRCSRSPRRRVCGCTTVTPY
ncbi:STAS domain-containing protein [Streptomyces sp. NPDC058739]|uniref:STAS domain-containing protein n=1 Tax=Streptomyces sp. NPDC058739 TaxID=3346618 RepID=UPI0036B6D4F6